MKLLHIDSSITGEGSASRRVSAAIVGALREAIPSLDIVRRDLHADPLPHLDSKSLPVIRPANPGDAANEVLDEFLAADIVVIGVPMYNFSIPSQLKAWVDRILVPGGTFRYTATGPQGLAGGKEILIASTRGGLYAPGMPFEVNDFQEKYLRAVFAFIGIDDIEIVRAEGLALGASERDGAIGAALASVPASVGLPARSVA